MDNNLLCAMLAQALKLDLVVIRKKLIYLIPLDSFENKWLRPHKGSGLGTYFGYKAPCSSVVAKHVVASAPISYH